MNIAKTIFFKEDDDGLARFQATWNQRSVQTWSPFAEPGSPEAFMPAASRARRESTYPPPFLTYLMIELRGRDEIEMADPVYDGKRD